MRLKFVVLLASGAFLLAATSAEAVSYSLDFTGADWETPDVTGVHGYGDPSTSPSWANDAGINNDYGGPKRLRLTNNAGGQLGNAWYNAATVQANAAWSAQFDMQITYEVGGGADGIGFHLQESGIGANTWIQGQGLGSNFLSVVMDSWDNGGGCDFGLEIFNNGSQVGSCYDLASIGPAVNNIYTVAMTYDGSGNLGVNVTNTGTTPGSSFGQTGVLNYAVDLSTLDAATFGWSAQTGGAAQNQDILNMSGTFVPEPGTALLLCIGLAGLAGSRRRTR